MIRIFIYVYIYSVEVRGERVTTRLNDSEGKRLFWEHFFSFCFFSVSPPPQPTGLFVLFVIYKLQSPRRIINRRRRRVRAMSGNLHNETVSAWHALTDFRDASNYSGHTPVPRLFCDKFYSRRSSLLILQRSFQKIPLHLRSVWGYGRFVSVTVRAWAKGSFPFTITH